MRSMICGWTSVRLSRPRSTAPVTQLRAREPLQIDRRVGRHERVDRERRVRRDLASAMNAAPASPVSSSTDQANVTWLVSFAGSIFCSASSSAVAPVAIVHRASRRAVRRRAARSVSARSTLWPARDAQRRSGLRRVGAEIQRQLLELRAARSSPSCSRAAAPAPPAPGPSACARARDGPRRATDTCRRARARRRGRRRRWP